MLPRVSSTTIDEHSCEADHPPAGRSNGAPSGGRVFRVRRHYVEAAVCTIVALHRVVPGLPVIVAANRDEMYARGATPPQLVRATPHRIVAGIDEEQGGSWMGVTSRGLFVGLTNQRSDAPPDATRASRGHVVLAALAAADAEDARRTVASLDARDYNGFNLLFGDARALYAAYARPSERAVRIEAVPEGIHALPNDVLDAPHFPKVARAAARAERIPARWPELREALAALLADHEKPSLAEVEAPPPGGRFDRAFLRELHALCIHTPIYGTRSATIAALAPDTTAAYWYADGPPCTTPFVDYTALVTPA